MPREGRETEEERVKADNLVGIIRTPYKNLKRTRWTGPMSLGKSFELREDLYSAAFVY